MATGIPKNMWEAGVDFVMHGGTNKRASVFSGRKKVFKEDTSKQEEYVLAFLDIFFKGAFVSRNCEYLI